MDKMRGEFNEAVATGAILPDFFCVTSGYSSSIKWLSEDWDGKKYRNDKLQSAWSIWKASRAALRVELPVSHYGNMLEDEVASALDDSGVSYK